MTSDAMVDNGHWSKQNEKLVKTIRNDIILTALDAGYNVVVDDTNIEGTNVEDITSLVETTYLGKVDFDTKFFDTPISECIRRIHSDQTQWERKYDECTKSQGWLFPDRRVQPRSS